MKYKKEDLIGATIFADDILFRFICFEDGEMIVTNIFYPEQEDETWDIDSTLNLLNRGDWKIVDPINNSYDLY